MLGAPRRPTHPAFQRSSGCGHFGACAGMLCSPLQLPVESLPVLIIRELRSYLC